MVKINSLSDLILYVFLVLVWSYEYEVSIGLFELKFERGFYM